ncbi:hypothetical protein ACQP0C_41595 (plasmid) [Nocardia sp. CA-129566]|uniref:hypothetical protein n=1 Tax=Nocardia sp. CA-129566 TaxID=3239976 RepID=UPI003D96CA0A
MMNLRLKPKSPPIADKDLTSGELSERVQTARGRLAFQHDPALLDALSERELAANRELAERIRDYGRREDLARVETAATAAERMRRTADRLADQEADDLVTARQAIVEQRRQHSPHARLAWLHRRRGKVLRGLTLLMAFAMIFSAVTVQQNIAPTGGVGNPMWWLSYGLEGLISGMLIAIAISASDTAEWVIDEDEWKVRTAEVALLLVTIGLNTYPYIGDGNVYGIAVHMIAPVMIGFALVIHDAASKRYSRAIEAVTNSITEAESDITARLAELARLTDVPTTATRIESERIDATTPALEQAPAVVRDSGAGVENQPRPEPAVRTTPHPHSHSATRTTAGTAGPAPVAEPAVRDDARTAAGSDPAPAHAVRDDTGAEPAPGAGELEDAIVHTHADEVADLLLVRTRTENPHQSTGSDAPAAAARTAVNSSVEPIETDVEHDPVESGAVAAVRPRTTPHQSTPSRVEASPAPMRAQARTTTMAVGAGTATAAALQPQWMSPVFELAAEVKARGIAKTKPVETVAAVITAIDANEKNNAIANAPETKMSHSTVESIRRTVAEIRHEHRGGGRVIELRKQGN